MLMSSGSGAARLSIERGVSAPATKSRCAIVSGVARHCGIGRSIVDAFIREGYNVLGTDIREMEQQPSSDRFKFFQADVSDAAHARSIVATAVERFGEEIHVLINNAARTSHALHGEDPVEAFDKMIKTNLNGAFYLSSYVLPHMPRGQSSIVHISSTRALQSEPDTPGYSASKAGLCGLTHSQAITYAGAARVNVILPGWINTESSSSELREEDHRWHPVGRVGVPADIAELCVFLCDENKAGFITGQKFVVDGGTTVKMVYPE